VVVGSIPISHPKAKAPCFDRGLLLCLVSGSTAEPLSFAAPNLDIFTWIC